VSFFPFGMEGVVWMCAFMISGLDLHIMLLQRGGVTIIILILIY
jgi:hypothetical protein